MKTAQTITLTAAAVALLSFSLPLPALSEMKNMSHREHKAGDAHMSHREHKAGDAHMMMGNMDRMDEMMGMCIEHADKMGLTDDQLNKVKPLHREMQKKQVRFKAEQKIAEIELMELMEVKDFDLEKAGSAVKKSVELKTAHQLEILKAMKEMRTTLTDEQFKKMKKMMPMKMEHKKPAKKMMKKQE